MSSDVEIYLPCSKSIALRALALRYSAACHTRLSGLTRCTDICDMEEGLKLLSLSRQATPVEIKIREGGAPYRFLMALAASTPGSKVKLLPGHRLAQRPIQPLADALREAGACITEIDADSGLPGGFLIEGKSLGCKTLRIDGRLSSQFESAAILASPLWTESPTFSNPGSSATSGSYLNMSLQMLKLFGMKPDKFEIEADWSAASYFYGARIVAASRGKDFRIHFPGLGDAAGSLQGDAAIVSLTDKALQLLGEARRRGGKPDTLEADMSGTPDLVPALAVACALAGIPFRFRGTASLRVKESDRIAALQEELAKSGFTVYAYPENNLTLACDSVSAKMPDSLTVNPHGDHRIAMSLSLARMAGVRVEIRNPEVVNKSFPDFFKELEKLEYLL